MKIKIYYSEGLDMLYIKLPNSERAWLYHDVFGWVRSRQNWKNKVINSDMELIGEL